MVDTGAIVALIIDTDEHHERAQASYSDLLGQGRLVITDDIFDETITQVRRKMSHRGAVETGLAIRDGKRFEILLVTREDRARAWELFETYGQTVRSLTDCSTAAVMERLGIETIFAFDRDFRTLGKTVVP